MTDAPKLETTMDELVKALRAGEQADMDGTVVKVSRQACEEAANAIEVLQAERGAEIARLREALLDATAHLIAAAASYRTYARRGGDIRPRAEVDAFFTTSARDYDRAAERARTALGDDNR